MFDDYVNYPSCQGSLGVRADRVNNDKLIDKCLTVKCDVFHDKWNKVDLKGITCNPYSAFPMVYICHCRPELDRVTKYQDLVSIYKRITKDSQDWCWIDVESVSVNHSSSSYNGSWMPVPPPPKSASPATITKYINQTMYRFHSSLVKVNSLVKEVIKIKELPDFQEFLAYGGWPFLAVGIVLYIMTSVLVTYFSRYHIK